MIKKYIKVITCFSIIFLLGLSFSVYSVVATSDNIDDPEDDVVTFDAATQECESTSLHPELDIDSMVRSGQEFTIMLHEFFDSSDGYSYMFSIKDGNDEYIVTYAFGMPLYFTKIAEGNWNGEEFVSGPAIEIGSVSGKVMEFEIPSDALTVTGSMEWVFQATFFDENTEVTYLDICPNSYMGTMCPGYDTGDGDDTTNGDDTTDGDGTDDEDDGSSISDLLDRIPGYEMTFLMIITGFITIGIIYIYKRKIIKL